METTHSTAKQMGEQGESIACDYLMGLGYQILQQNYHSRYGEIDIVAQLGTTLAFVEVKTRQKNSQVSGFEAVTVRKQRKIIRTALEYMKLHQLDLQPRFDVCSLTASGEGYTVDYLSAAFSGAVY